jgi:menaquinone-specific isochorismate synthase
VNLPGQISYGFEFEGEGMCGITPEVLFRVREGSLETMALAGTAALGAPSLLDDPKERREHQLVIENLTTELAAWGHVETGPTAERDFGRLKHLHTPIRVRLSRSPEFETLCDILHPTAALGGWPRKPAWQWLSEQPFHRSRRRFGAPFGFVRHDDHEGEERFCVVAIRGLQWQGREAQIHAGCGVVEGSVAEREWQELALKREAIHRNLGISI